VKFCYSSFMEVFWAPRFEEALMVELCVDEGDVKASEVEDFGHP
jgi:hypothetical protein